MTQTSLFADNFFLLSNTTEQPKGTSMPYYCITRSNVFSMNFLEILGITKNSLLRCQLSYFALASIRLDRYDSFFRLILLLLGDINVNPGPTTVNNIKTPLNNLPLHNSNNITAIN